MPTAIASRVLRLLPFALVALVGVGCGEDAPAPTSPGGTKVPPAERVWTRSEMVDDPEGYLTWADVQLANQAKKREEFLKTLDARRAEVRGRQQKAGADITELENFLNRLTRAVQRAEDEDRWPVKVGDRSYEQARARELLTTVPKQIELRKPLSDEYVKALAAMDAKEVAVKDEIAKLGDLRQRVALDLEKVRLHRGAAELGAVDQGTSEQIAYYARILGEINAEAAQAAPPKEGGLISLDNLLK